MRKNNIMLISVLLLVFSAAGCSGKAQPITKTVAQASDAPNLVASAMSKCSSVQIPDNTEVNTNIDKDAGIFIASWYDESKGKDVSISTHYNESDCSESVKSRVSKLIKENSSSSDKVSSINNKDQSPNPRKLKVELTKDFLSSASKGKLDGIEFGIGASKKEIEQEWGIPDDKGHENVEYYAYSDSIFYFWDHEKVGAIKLSLSKNELTSSDIERILGKPKFEGPDNEDGGYLLHYESGNYELFFSAESKDAPISNLVYKKLE
ncbi:DUF4309 domain-containing protein [Paenibacillus chondroitinus]|uniref:DUF4309 domain-containing protein n=1 Tax=Paenibacillus chondroitinus TaxID=59842 RepID=A0ABU6DGD9_9BACL|nr:DUF4309 domain-containing protein [Paenibacillus chondroitinus]MCY9659424.1 YjgB family protein [Paenibacillus anseongense]MEB4796819.1 DUF4309 domain-containing protein [Paenibacillus chondroitinus]